MSYDYLGQLTYEADIIQRFNRLRHYFLGRLTREAVKEELEAFNSSFDEISIEKLSSIIVGQMLFLSSERDTMAFEFSSALNLYLDTTKSDDREKLYNQFRDIAKLALLQELHDIPQPSKDLISSFLEFSIYSLAAKIGIGK